MTANTREIERAKLTLENFILALASESRKLPNNGLRLLIHVAARAIEDCTYTVTLSDRQLCEDLGIGRGHISIVKGSIAHLVRVHASQGITSTFTVPATWFPLQPTLFSTETGTLAGPPTPVEIPKVAPNGGQHWHPGGATTSPSELGTGTEPGPVLAPAGGQFGEETANAGTPRGPATTQNQQVTDDATRRLSISEVSCSSVERVYRIIDVSRVPPKLKPDAAELSKALQHHMGLLGNAEQAKTPPDDALLARCLAVAPLRELLPVLAIAKPRAGRPKRYGWFLTVFIETLEGISRQEQATIRDAYREMRRGKPMQHEDAGYLTPEAARLALGQVKSIR